MATTRTRLGIAVAAAVVVAGLGLTATYEAAAVNENAGLSAGQDRVVTLTVDGRARTYRLFVPPAPSTGRYRLVIALHPLGNAGRDFEQMSRLDVGAASAHALVAYPDGVDGSWNAGRCCGAAREHGIDDVAFLDAVIDDVEASYSVDTGDVAMGGLSNGALMTYRYVCARSSQVHVAFIASGALVTPSCQFSQPVQILHMHGMQDELVPWAGDQHSPYTTDHVMPSVRETTNSVAVADGCTPRRWTQTSIDQQVTSYTADGCPTGASVTVLVSRTLAHDWVTGPAAVSAYGIDETHAVWAFILGS